MKRTKNENPEIIDLDDLDKICKGQSGSTSNKRSWVWNHLKDIKGNTHATYQVIIKNGQICGKPVKKDKSGSTKMFHQRLSDIHRLSDPNLRKKTKMHHMDIKKWSKSGQLKPKIELNSKTLRSALVYMITDCNLPFAFIQQRSFRDLLALVNEEAMPLIKNTNKE
ncbi:hypothetical protein PGT21_020695 [Puccinia graminis f. sp. tritici]|uniref:Uncharacterized protein n=1 Tax=Puccinia graminis f. sp. tritici TaxID=56615 RepID=A0A5B0QQY7_PUCGR|nr:hypothetical protein PGT21_020695 [Puccinia graminis f. sp. tritici]KAA1115671.1 hypothetical protein PGTUg99_023652 [Puccinia graminis f. sp. tritici]